MRFAVKVGCLAFDSTRITAAGGDFPIDIVLFTRGTFHIIEHRYEKEELLDVSGWWQDRLRRSVNELPSQWIESAFSEVGPLNGKR
jgi:putative proteasome-type protease